MATYKVNVGKREYVVDVTDDQKIVVDGKQIQASLTPINEGGLFLFRKENRAREMHVKPEGNSGYAVMVNGRHVMAQVEKGTGRTRRRTEQATSGKLTAPMPGMVVNVLVKEGQRVDCGDPLVVLESMKMQMQLRSPFAGQVERVAVASKVQVEKGALLVQVAGD
jgi:biotin carboxyl carrier protein